MKPTNMLLLAASQLASLSQAANCANPKGTSVDPYVPTGDAWNAMQFGIQQVTSVFNSVDDGFVYVTLKNKPSEPALVQLAWDCKSAHSKSYASEAYNNIWSQCMDNGYRCDRAYETGTWALNGQWYWIAWFGESVGRKARSVIHCGLKERDGDGDGLHRRVPDVSGLDPLEWNPPIREIFSVTRTNVTKKELPTDGYIPPMFADRADDDVIELIEVVLDMD
jgi:hypothetical protein